jgi:cullin-associated NEDD8-dissociated protein 1
MSNLSDFPNVSALLKKTTHYDKDERYMATSDLCEVLKRSSAAASGDLGGTTSSSSSSSSSSHLDSSTERQICTAVLRLLHDKSNDVQAVAVKTLGVLLTTVQQEQVLEIADSLADQVLDAAKSELRDVYTIGLRTLVKTCPASMGHTVSQRLLGRLLDGIRNAINEEIVLACLDVLTDLLARFGATAVSVTRQHEPVLQMCLQQLNNHDTSPVIRKRASTTIGCLSNVLSDTLLQRST